MYTIPREARRKIKKSSANYNAYTEHLIRFLSNPAFKTASEAEKTRLVKCYISIMSEIYEQLNHFAGYGNVLNKLTV